MEKRWALCLRRVGTFTGRRSLPYCPALCKFPWNDFAALADAVNADTAAIILEPIQGEGGIQVPDADYLPRVRKLCD